MKNPFRNPLVCFAPDGVPDGAPAAEAENQQNQPETQQSEAAAPKERAEPQAVQTAAPAGEKQPAVKDEPKKDSKADDLAARIVTANARAIQAELRTAAALAGVPKARIPYVLRMCDTEGIDLDAADAQEKLDATVAKVLEAVPELRGSVGTGSAGNFARRNGSAEDALDAKIQANIMSAC